MNVVASPLSDDPDVKALIVGPIWSGAEISYSFPATPAQFTGYNAGTEPSNHFEALNAQQEAAVKGAFAQISSFTNLTFTESTGTNISEAVLRFGMSDDPPTAWGYLPSTEETGGDVWFNNSTGWYDDPLPGNYGWLTVLHEIGHTLGLGHPHEASPPMSFEHDWMAFTVMSYRSYQGAPVDDSGGYSNDDWSFAETYMLEDIAALQFLYGANFDTRSTDTVYTWSPTTGEMFADGVGQGTPGGNTIFMTLWDGGGNDTYDFSNYPSQPSGQYRGVNVSLGPGGWSTLIPEQVPVVLGHVMDGSIANPWLYNNDERSLIENVVGSPLDDTISGNSVANHLMGEDGFDVISGAGGDDIVDGGNGFDILYGGDGDDAIYGGADQDLMYGEAGADGLDGGDGDDDMRGGDGNDHLDGGAGDDSLEGGDGNDILNGGPGADRMVGGPGDDVYYVDNWIDPLLNPDGTYFFWSGIDSVDERAGEGYDRIITSVSLSLPSLIEVEAIDTSNPAGIDPINLAGNDSDNRLTGNSGANILDGKGGDDILAAGSGSDTLNGGAGNDGLFFGPNLDASDVADGGADFDQVGLQGDYLAGLMLGANSLVGIEQLVLLSGSDTRFGDTASNFYSYDLTTNDANVAAGERLVVTFNTLRAGENVTLDGAAETDGWFLTYAGKGADHVIGGQQSDGFFFGVSRWGAGDSVDGHGGTLDQLGLQGNYTAAGSGAIVFGAGQLTGTEVIVCLSGGDTRFGAPSGAGYSYDLTMNDGNVQAGQTLYISANTLKAADGSVLLSDETLTFDGSAESDGRFVIYSGNGADTIVGGAGNDTIYGGGGADALTGGAGDDVFAYIDAAHSTAGAIDQILDFAAGDSIDLSRIDAVPGGSGDPFAWIAGNAFSHTAGELRAFEQTPGHWQVEGDVDGDGVADLVIAVTTDHALTGADFVL